MARKARGISFSTASRGSGTVRKRSVSGLRGDTRLAPYVGLATDRFLTVPDPRLAVLKEIPRAFLAIRIRLTEPE